MTWHCSKENLKMASYRLHCYTSIWQYVSVTFFHNKKRCQLWMTKQDSARPAAQCPRSMTAEAFCHFFLISKPQCQVGSDLRSQRLGQHQDIAGLQNHQLEWFSCSMRVVTGASPQDGPGVEDGLTSRDFGPSFFTSIVEAFNHFPGHDITMFFFHLRWDWENHQHRVNPVSADGVEIREGICTGNSALIVWIQGDRGKEICSTCQIDCLTLSSCGTDGYQRNIWRVFGQHSTVSDVVQPAGQFCLAQPGNTLMGDPPAGGFISWKYPTKQMNQNVDDLWWLMMIYDDLY